MLITHHIIMYDLESHAVVVNCCFGMWQSQVWCFFNDRPESNEFISFVYKPLILPNKSLRPF